jgi:flagellar hook-basal body complex protein FliE
MISQFPKALEMVQPLASALGSQNQSARGETFAAVMQGAIESVRTSHADATRQVQAFLSGEQQDLHQVATAVQKAGLTFEVAMEVRNRMVSAYQEVMRMQI